VHYIHYNTGSFVKIGRIRAFVMDENGNLKAKIQQILQNQELPGNFQRVNHDLNRLWMTENVIMIAPSQIRSKVSVWLEDTEEPFLYEYKISNILYSFDNHYKTRSISLHHRHPSEYIKLLPSPPGVQVLKIFIDLYFDDFGTFRTSYHSLGGLYIQFGNMTLKLRQKLKNHFLIGFVPFGGNFKDIINPFINDVILLQKGLIMKINNEDYWIIGGLGVVTADLPQGNDLAGVLRHNANFGCRSCKASKEELSLLDFDIQQYGRYHHITNDEFLEIQQSESQNAKVIKARSFGLCLKPNILDKLFRDRHTQTPQDPFHMIAGLGGRLLNSTFEIFSKKGLDTFVVTWKSFEISSTWSHQQNPITHRQSYFMSDILRLTMIYPFILKRFLSTEMIKDDIIQKIRQQNSLRRSSQAIAFIFQCWVSFAILAKLVFTSSLRDSDYSRLDQLLNIFIDNVLKVIILFIVYYTLFYIVLLSLTYHYSRYNFRCFQVIS
jgi:hypothetical protein